MRLYNIFAANNHQKNLIFIEERFSVIAAFFSLLWLLYHKMWKHALMIFSAQASLSLAAHYELISSQLLISLSLIMALLVGSFANTWYIKSLESKDYHLEDVLAAKNMEEAKFRFYQNYTIS